MGVHLPLPDGLLSGWSTINVDLLPLISRLRRHFERQCWSSGAGLDSATDSSS